MAVSSDPLNAKPRLITHLHTSVRLHGLLHVVQGSARLASTKEVQTVGVVDEGLEFQRWALVEHLSGATCFGGTRVRVHPQICVEERGFVACRLVYCMFRVGAVLVGVEAHRLVVSKKNGDDNNDDDDNDDKERSHIPFIFGSAVSSLQGQVAMQ